MAFPPVLATFFGPSTTHPSLAQGPMGPTSVLPNPVGLSGQWTDLRIATWETNKGFSAWVPKHRSTWVMFHIYVRLG